MKKEFYQSPIAKIYYDDELDALFLEYLSKVQGEKQFIEINTELLKTFQLLSTEKFVVDIRKMGIIGIAAQQWVANTLLPGMVKHLKGKTLFHAQIIDPKEVMSKVSGSNIKNKTSKTNDNIQLVQFTDMDCLKTALMDWV